MIGKRQAICKCENHTTSIQNDEARQIKFELNIRKKEESNQRTMSEDKHTTANMHAGIKGKRLGYIRVRRHVRDDVG